MKLNKLKISTQLILGFAAVLLFVGVLGTVSFFQTNQIQGNLDTLYNHPLIVRRALSDLRLDISEMQLLQREMLITQDENGPIQLAEAIALEELNARENIDILEERYLGPKSDIVRIKQDFESWKTLFDMDTQLIINKETALFVSHVGTDGSTFVALSSLTEAVSIVDQFARNKGDSLYEEAVLNKTELNTQLMILIGVILLLTLIISYSIVRTIQTPLQHINTAVTQFHKGNMKARIVYDRHNEFSQIADSINIMMEDVDRNSMLKDQVSDLSSVMLIEDNQEKFFRNLMPLLMENTNSQLSAVYLLNEKKESFDHFISIGASSDIKKSYSLKDLEGEMGKSIITGKRVIISDIPESTQFAYHSNSGTFLPKEIMTIPLISNQRMIGILSLATLFHYDELMLSVIDSIQMAMNARIDGIMISQKNKDYQASLEVINQELTAHRQELSSQALELLQQNSELEMQKNQLNEASKLKTSFLANMSHELRTPLNSVIALSGILGRKLKDDISQENYSYIEIIERNGKNLLELINDILDLSRIEAGKEDIESVFFDLNQLITELVQMIKPQADSKNIDLIFETDDNEIPVISDLRKCRQIIQNLIGNAVKFTQKGSVTIKVTADSESFSVCVIDTGIGISKEHLNRIFDEFRQADDTTSRRFGGTGLGLAIARKYAKLLGGDVTVASELNVGSQFTLTLTNRPNGDIKTQNETRSQANEKMDLISDHRLEHKSILLVDDNETALIQIRDLLADTGIHVLTASNAAEAFQIINRQIPDAMVLDLMMPDVDGFSVLEQLRNADETAQIPVLVLTAKHISKEDIKSLKRNNVHQLILKGYVEKDELQKAIASMLTLKRFKTKTIKRMENFKPLVLVAEDNPDNMVTVKALLKDQFILIEANDGEEALSLANERKPDLILMDLALPLLSGMEVMRSLRNNATTKEIPIIALSAGVMEYDRVNLVNKGFNAFVSKPINEMELNQTIDKVLYDK